MPGLNRIIIVLSTQITQCLADVYLFTFFLHSKFSNQHPCCTSYNEVIFTTYLLKNLEHQMYLFVMYRKQMFRMQMHISLQTQRLNAVAKLIM